MASSGNIATLNPLHKMSTGTFSNGNLKYALSGDDGYVATMSMTKKSYCEVRLDATSGNGGSIGIRSGQCNQYYTDSLTFQTNYSSGDLYLYKNTSGTDVGDIGGVISAGDIVMMAYDPATYKWWVGVNGTWRSSGNPATGANPMYTGSATMFENMENIFWGGWKSSANGMTVTFNFGQDSTFGGQETAGGNADENGFGDFKYTPPTGFLCNSSGNIAISDDIDPAQTDDDYPSKQFNTVLYTGNGSTNAITGLGFKPDLVWVKRRNSSGDQRLVDSSRGVGVALRSNVTGGDVSEANGVTAFGTDGFTLGSEGGYNASSDTFVGWCWKANGGTTASNSEGSITTTVQANTKAGFSIINYTGNGSNATIGHGLTKAPEFVIFKRRSGSAQNWRVYHAGIGATKRLTLNDTRAAETVSTFQNTTPTSTVISIGSDSNVNTSSGSQLAYAWHSVGGSSKFGSYEGNGNNDGAFIYTGFRPRLVFIKNADAAQHWVTHDSARETFNPMDTPIDWDESYAEYTSSARAIDFLSNGFKCRTSDGEINSSQTFVYGAWGDVPFKYNNTF